MTKATGPEELAPALYVCGTGAIATAEDPTDTMVARTALVCAVLESGTYVNAGLAAADVETALAPAAELGLAIEAPALVGVDATGVEDWAILPMYPSKRSDDAAVEVSGAYVNSTLVEEPLASVVVVAGASGTVVLLSVLTGMARLVCELPSWGASGDTTPPPMLVVDGVASEVTELCIIGDG